MQRPHNDRWERTRRYLQRNLVEYQGDLSTISEESRSDSSDGRPYSPLPELVVEREPNRHDHDEQFYEALAVKMRRYYKRLFEGSGSNYGLNEAYLHDAEDISEFEINRSMASTFIIDTNNRIDEETQQLIANETEVDFDSNVGQDKTREVSKNTETQSTYVLVEERSKTYDIVNVTEDKGKHSGSRELSHSIRTRSDVSPNEDRTKVSNTVNTSEKMLVSNREASKSIDTDSDLVQNYHRVLTTVAQVHDEVQRVKATRVFEDGSPVLMPRAHQLNRSVFGNMPLQVRNIMSSVDDDDKEEGHVEGEREEIKEDDNNTPVSTADEAEEHQSKIVVVDLDSDLEVEWLMKGADSNSNNQESIDTRDSCEEEEISEDVDQYLTPDSTNVELVAFDDADRKAIEDENESLLTSESDGVIQFQDEESIGPNDFDRIELTPKATNSETHEETFEPVDSSFEMALRKGIFESKNVRKTAVESSDEELKGASNEIEGFENVEVMRGTMQTRLQDTLRRESTMSKDSPLAVKFATQATAEELEEDISDHDDDQINAFDAVMTENDDDRSLQGEESTSQESSVTSAPRTQVAEELGFSDNFISGINASVDEENGSNGDADANTPPVETRSIADVFDDIWSVSPVKINFEELSPKGHDLPNSRNKLNQKKRVRVSDTDVNRPVNKKKRYSNIAGQTKIQAGASKESTENWNNVKSNFFVGKPLIFKLCSCHDHVCP